MKKIFTAIVILFSLSGHAQTVLPNTTTVYALSLMKNGQYRIVTGTDTLDVVKDSAIYLTKIIHDTIPRVCPVVKPQRALIGLSYNPLTNQWIATYGDNSTTIFAPTKTVFIQ